MSHIASKEIFDILHEKGHPWLFCGSVTLALSEFPVDINIVPKGIQDPVMVVVFGLPIRDLSLWIWHAVGQQRLLFANHILERAADTVLDWARRRGVVAVDLARSAPGAISLVTLACRAGLGTRGINNLFLHPEYGAWVQLHAILIESSAREQAAPALPSVCIGCMKCVDACPAHAISVELFSAERCSRMVAAFWMPKSKARAISATAYVECHRCISVCPVGVEPTPFHGGEVL